MVGLKGKDMEKAATCGARVTSSNVSKGQEFPAICSLLLYLPAQQFALVHENLFKWTQLLTPSDCRRRSERSRSIGRGCYTLCNVPG